LLIFSINEGMLSFAFSLILCSTTSCESELKRISELQSLQWQNRTFCKADFAIGTKTSFNFSLISIFLESQIGHSDTSIQDLDILHTVCNIGCFWRKNKRFERKKTSFRLKWKNGDFSEISPFSGKNRAACWNIYNFSRILCWKNYNFSNYSLKKLECILIRFLIFSNRGLHWESFLHNFFNIEWDLSK